MRRYLCLGLSLAAPILLALLVVSPSAAQSAKFKVLHTFVGGSDGANPTSRLAFDPAGNLYGTALAGGTGAGCSGGCGTAFELVLSGVAWKERILYDFSNVNGLYQSGPLAIDTRGNLYGTTTNSGDPSCQCGFVYQLTRSGSVWTENNLHNFLGGTTDGDYTRWGVVRDGAGNLFGVTNSGGLNTNFGTLFEFTPNADGSWTYNVIHEFGNYPDGYSPSGLLTLDPSGNLYGTTMAGGLYGYGTVYKLTQSGGTWSETILYNFTSDFGMYPQPDGVAMDAAGNLYGAATNSGEYSVGVLYKLTPTSGYWNRTVLHTFNGGDGAYPLGGLTVDPTGAVYGTALEGGIYGYGIVYKLAKGTHGQWNLAVLHNFSGSDGSFPYGGVALDQAGNLYGTAEAGGTSGFGIAFEILH